VSKDREAAAAAWLIAAGALVLFGSLFLTWSHQFSPYLLSVLGNSGVLDGVPRDPTAWQVYSTADVLLALVAAALMAVALRGNRAARQCAAVAVLIALVFAVHAVIVPPTNGALIFNPAESVPNYIPNAAGAGVGETIAILGLLLALGGLTVSIASQRA
jgi:hypothetical protein